MKKYKLLLIITPVLIMAGLLLYVQKDEQMSSTRDSTATEESVSEITTSSMPSSQSSPGVYTEYSEAAFNNATGKKLLFFHASWCRQCQMIEADIVKNGLPANVNVFKINYDTAVELRKKYEVTLQTTFVNVTNDGSIIKKYVAYEQPNLNSVLENAL